MTTMDGFEADDFVSVAQLHFELGVSIGALATAIEEKGVWGWDRFGRFVLLPPSVQAVPAIQPVQPLQDVLNRLAKQHQFNEGPGDLDGDLDPTSDPLWFHGWRFKDLPDFTGISERQPSPKRAGDIARVENGLYMQIGALLEVIIGYGPWQGHPDVKNQSKLIETLCERFKRMPSMSKRTLETSFARARKALTEA
ncbi:hypothetical protein [Roseateles sp.]|uniref:hypothetical protein n=1 Tax=Roseateles sp. TaxID=1971397 RepID=UPI0037C7A754